MDTDHQSQHKMKPKRKKTYPPKDPPTAIPMSGNTPMITTWGKRDA
jgi:hypothetical protein